MLAIRIHFIEIRHRKKIRNEKEERWSDHLEISIEENETGPLRFVDDDYGEIFPSIEARARGTRA